MANEEMVLTQDWLNQRFLENRKLVLERGEYRVGEVLYFPSNTETVIKPGVRVRMSWDASLIFHGKLIAVGEADDPIVVEPFASKRALSLASAAEWFEIGLGQWVTWLFPRSLADRLEEELKRVLKSKVWHSRDKWGGIALSGSGANGSQVAYIRLISGYCPYYESEERFKDKPRTWRGVLAIDQASVELHHLLIERSYADALHILDTDAIVSESIFLDNDSDCIDLDEAKAVIRNNIFVRCGGDAIDLYQSEAEILDNEIVLSFGNGIEVGQRSRALIERNRILQSGQSAIELSDESEAAIHSNTFAGNTRITDTLMKEPGDFAWSGKILSFRDNQVADDT